MQVILSRGQAWDDGKLRTQKTGIETEEASLRILVEKEERHQTIGTVATSSNTSPTVGGPSELPLQVTDDQQQHHRQTTTIKIYWCGCVWQLGAEQQQVHLRSATQQN